MEEENQIALQAERIFDANWSDRISQYSDLIDGLPLKWHKILYSIGGIHLFNGVEKVVDVYIQCAENSDPDSFIDNQYIVRAESIFQERSFSDYPSAKAFAQGQALRSIIRCIIDEEGLFADFKKRLPKYNILIRKGEKYARIKSI